MSINGVLEKVLGKENSLVPGPSYSRLPGTHVLLYSAIMNHVYHMKQETQQNCASGDNNILAISCDSLPTYC